MSESPRVAKFTDWRNATSVYIPLGRAYAVYRYNVSETLRDENTPESYTAIQVPSGDSFVERYAVKEQPDEVVKALGLTVVNDPTQF